MFGMPTSDSDIYGNILMHAWDDAIEAEGSNMNVRIWGNYMDQTATGVATTSTSRGPCTSSATSRTAAATSR